MVIITRELLSYTHTCTNITVNATYLLLRAAINCKHIEFLPLPTINTSQINFITEKFVSSIKLLNAEYLFHFKDNSLTV